MTVPLGSSARTVASGNDGAGRIGDESAEATVAADKRRGVGLRRELRAFRQSDDGAAAVVRLGELLDKGMGRAGDEGEFDVVPVFADGIVHDAPALQERLLGGVGRQHDAVGGFPDGHFADVADVEIAIAIAGGGNGHAADILIARGGDQAEVAGDFQAEVIVENADGGGWIEVEAAYFPGIGDEGDFFGFDGEVGVGAGLAFDTEEFADDGRGRAAADFDASAAQSAEQVGHGGLFAEGETQGSEAMGERSFGVVVDAGDAAAGEIENGEGIEDVVELGAGEVDMHAVAATDAAQVFEEADTVFVENDAAHGKIGRWLGGAVVVGGGGSARWGGGRRSLREEKRWDDGGKNGGAHT